VNPFNKKCPHASCANPKSVTHPPLATPDHPGSLLPPVLTPLASLPRYNGPADIQSQFPPQGARIGRDPDSRKPAGTNKYPGGSATSPEVPCSELLRRNTQRAVLRLGTTHCYSVSARCKSDGVLSPSIHDSDYPSVHLLLRRRGFRVNEVPVAQARRQNSGFVIPVGLRT
jgi:hypothetical protein